MVSSITKYIPDQLKEAVWISAGWGSTSCKLCECEMLRGIGITYCSNKECSDKQTLDWLDKLNIYHEYWRTDED